MSGDWYVPLDSREARAVLDMFGYEGNTEDYWMGTPYDRVTEVGWRPAEEIVRTMRTAEIDWWSRGRRFRIGDREETHESIEQMVEEEPNAHDRAGGLVGLDTTKYFRWKNKLTVRGMLEDRITGEHHYAGDVTGR
jgi:hypothetical protein